MLSALFGIGRPVKPSMSSHKGDDYIKNEYGYSFLMRTIYVVKTKFINDIWSLNYIE